MFKLIIAFVKIKITKSKSFKVFRLLSSLYKIYCSLKPPVIGQQVVASTMVIIIFLATLEQIRHNPEFNDNLFSYARAVNIAYFDISNVEISRC